MAVEPGYKYDWYPTRQYCRQLGMLIDEPWFPLADREADKVALTQNQFDAGMRLHAWHVRSLFDPGRYKLLQRLALAWHFLFGRPFGNPVLRD